MQKTDSETDALIYFSQLTNSSTGTKYEPQRFSIKLLLKFNFFLISEHKQQIESNRFPISTEIN